MSSDQRAGDDDDEEEEEEEEERAEEADDIRDLEAVVSMAARTIATGDDVRKSGRSYQGAGA